MASHNNLIGIAALACGVSDSAGAHSLRERIARCSNPLHGYRMGQASAVAPFEFTGMIWAAFWGFAIFGEVPRVTTFIGMALIAAAGVLALRAGAK